jgi:hypothetical protein
MIDRYNRRSVMMQLTAISRYPHHSCAAFLLLQTPSQFGLIYIDLFKPDWAIPSWPGYASGYTNVCAYRHVDQSSGWGNIFNLI